MSLHTSFLFIDYTNYINYLLEILTDGQNLILDLSRGYKTAARVDYEWKEKMKKMINEVRKSCAMLTLFHLMFIYCFRNIPFVSIMPGHLGLMK